MISKLDNALANCARLDLPESVLRRLEHRGDYVGAGLDYLDRTEGVMRLGTKNWGSAELRTNAQAEIALSEKRVRAEVIVPLDVRESISEHDYYECLLVGLMARDAVKDRFEIIDELE